MMQISFHELAERELNDAALYYEHESPELGIKFLNDVERLIHAIGQNPMAGKKVRGQVRRASYAHFLTASCIQSMSTRFEFLQ